MEKERLLKKHFFTKKHHNYETTKTEVSLNTITKLSNIETLKEIIEVALGEVQQVYKNKKINKKFFESKIENIDNIFHIVTECVTNKNVDGLLFLLSSLSSYKGYKPTILEKLPDCFGISTIEGLTNAINKKLDSQFTNKGESETISSKLQETNPVMVTLLLSGNDERKKLANLTFITFTFSDFLKDDSLVNTTSSQSQDIYFADGFESMSL